MSGSTCSIPVRDRLSGDRVQQLLHWLHGVSNRADMGQPIWQDDADYWSFDIAHTEPLGFTGKIEMARPFSLSLVQNRTEHSISWSDGFTDWQGRYIDAYVLKQDLEHERRQWLAHLGYFPAQRLSLEAHSNRNIDHQLLAYLALRLAERYEGLVDMDGALTPPRARPPLRKSSLEEIRVWLGSDTPPSLKDVHGYVQQLPGHVHEFTYTCFPDNRMWVRHVLDLTAFHGWIQHRDFHMVK